ncbi:MAG: carbohydrate kinase family protein [Lachnospiraceae bacterium]|nr:carbohydrate kinase family protein [Lachnospiraceae bacterium]
MGIVVIGTVFVDVKGFPNDVYLPTGRNVGKIEYVHGGVARNVVEDIANLELRPTFISTVDTTSMGKDVVEKLARHKVNVDYIKAVPDGMGTWLAIFDQNGELAGSISQRADTYLVMPILEQHGDEIFKDCDSVIFEIDMHKDVVKKIFELAIKYNKKVYALVSNMGIALERRDFLQRLDCFICNELEAGMLFCDDYSETTPEELSKILPEKIKAANIPSMIVTMGGKGAVYAEKDGNSGMIPARKVVVKDTTGAGDAFCAGAMSGLTYGKTMAEAVGIGTVLSSSVITTMDNVCPRFRPEEFGLEVSHR